MKTLVGLKRSSTPHNRESEDWILLASIALALLALSLTVLASQGPGMADPSFAISAALP